MALIYQQLADALHHLGIGDKVVHLMHTAVATVGIRILVMMLSMLIVELTILLATFYNHTYTPHVMMMHHHRREQHTHRGHQEAE